MTVYLYLVSGHKVWQCIAIFCQYFHFLTPLHSPNRPMRVVVCVRWKLALERREEKKTILERARGHFNYFSFALAFWSFPIKIWCKTARLSWSTPNLATRRRTMSNKLNKAKNCSAICRHFHSQRNIYIYHAAFKHENIDHNKMKRKVYNIDFLFTVTLRNNEQDEALCFLIYYLYIPINLVL